MLHVELGGDLGVILRLISSRVLRERALMVDLRVSMSLAR